MLSSVKQAWKCIERLHRIHCLKLREQNYQTAAYLIFALMGQFVQAEVHCSTGRADCVVQTADSIYIFEFKLTGNGTAEDAINQIKE